MRITKYTITASSSPLQTPKDWTLQGSNDTDRWDGLPPQLLPDEDCSFEGGTVGGWLAGWNCALANDAANGYHGSHSLKLTVTANGTGYGYCSVTALTAAATQYTFAVKSKSATGRTYRVKLWDDVAGYQQGSVITADGTWQTATVTATFGAGSTNRRIYIFAESDALAGDIVYWDSIILKAGASATPPPNPDADIIDTVVNETGWSAGEKRTFNIQNPGYYRHYELNATDSNAGGYVSAVAFELIAGGSDDETPTMTANNAPSPYVCSASTEYSATYAAWKAFDKDGTSKWCTTAGSTGWLRFDFGQYFAKKKIFAKFQG